VWHTRRTRARSGTTTRLQTADARRLDIRRPATATRADASQQERASATFLDRSHRQTHLGQDVRAINWERGSREKQRTLRHYVSLFPPPFAPFSRSRLFFGVPAPARGAPPRPPQFSPPILKPRNSLLQRHGTAGGDDARSAMARTAGNPMAAARRTGCLHTVQRSGRSSLRSGFSGSPKGWNIGVDGAEYAGSKKGVPARLRIRVKQQRRGGGSPRAPWNAVRRGHGRTHPGAGTMRRKFQRLPRRYRTKSCGDGPQDAIMAGTISTR